eukprot:1428752-Alexandrium_andersonii.AAC.1
MPLVSRAGGQRSAGEGRRRDSSWPHPRRAPQAPPLDTRSWSPASPQPRPGMARAEWRHPRSQPAGPRLSLIHI